MCLDSAGTARNRRVPAGVEVRVREGRVRLPIEEVVERAVIMRKPRSLFYTKMNLESNFFLNSKQWKGGCLTLYWSYP